jgi:hypothetical protein
MATERLKAGVAEVEITGQAGLALAGELNSRPSTAVGTPLMAKAMVLSNTAEMLAVVTLDLFGVQGQVANKLSHLISEQCDLKPEALLLVSSHTRSAPYTTHVVGSPELNETYLEEIVSKVAASVAQAQDALQEASLGIGHVSLPHLIYNHRLLTRNMKAISAWMGIPKNEVLEPEGPIDPEFRVLVVRDNRGHPICFLWNFAADNRFRPHEDDQISAGLPYFVQQELDERLGQHVPSLYLPGCGGNISFHGDLAQVSEAIASAVMAAQLETSGDPMIKLSCGREKMVLPIRDYSQFWSKADIELKYPQALEAYAHELELLRQEGAQGLPATVQVFRLGKFAVAGLPGIPFTEFGLALKQRSPFRSTLVVGNVGGYLGYVITRQAFEHEGFETWPARSAKVGPGAGEFVTEVAANLLQELWNR